MQSNHRMYLWIQSGVYYKASAAVLMGKKNKMWYSPHDIVINMLGVNMMQVGSFHDSSFFHPYPERPV